MTDRLIVFDLDFTLWDAGGTWCDCCTPPFSRRHGRVIDARGGCIDPYPDIPRILEFCEVQGYLMATASRTDQPSWAKRILDLLELRDRFAFEEIYPGSKTRHFHALQRQSGLDFEQMIFFDDEHRNIHEVGDLGVQAVHVPRGMTWRLFEQALA